MTIYDAATEAQYGLVLIPIASRLVNLFIFVCIGRSLSIVIIIIFILSIVVVILIISGVALHAHYRNRLAVEVCIDIDMIAVFILCKNSHWTDPISLVRRIFFAKFLDPIF